MAKLIINRLKVDAGIIKFDLKLNNGLTVIGGRSSTGKTLLYDTLQDQSIADGTKKFKFINYLRLNDSIPIKDLFKESGKIFIVDNADILMDIPNIGLHIENDKKNQYIIFARDIAKYILTKDRVATIREENGTLVLSYPFIEAIKH